MKSSSAEEFLEEMRREVGVSQRFLESARPIVQRLFTDVPAAHRAACMLELRETFARQARIEAAVSRALQGITELRREAVARGHRGKPPAGA